MTLKGSKTEQNLKDAFAGESQANRRYLYFNRDYLITLLTNSCIYWETVFSKLYTMRTKYSILCRIINWLEHGTIIHNSI